MTMHFGLFCCLFLIVCLASEALARDERRIQVNPKWKERTQSWCTTKWSSNTSRIKTFIHAAGSEVNQNDGISYRVCQWDQTDCTTRRLSWTHAHWINIKGETMILSRITIPADRAQCDGCILQWSLNTAGPGQLVWQTCRKHQSERHRRGIAEVTLGPPGFEWTIDSVDLELHTPTTPRILPTTPRMTAPPATTPKTFPSKVCKAVGLWATVPGMSKWCTTNCNLGNCPSDRCECKGTKPPKSKGCIAVNQYAETPGMDAWCVFHCGEGYCPPSHCSCGYPGPKGLLLKCKSRGLWATVDGMNEWCNHNCAKKFCPADRCACVKA